VEIDYALRARLGSLTARICARLVKTVFSRWSCKFKHACLYKY